MVVGRDKTTWGWEGKQNLKRDERALVSGLGVIKSQLAKLWANRFGAVARLSVINQEVKTL